MHKYFPKFLRALLLISLTPIAVACSKQSASPTTTVADAIVTTTTTTPFRFTYSTDPQKTLNQLARTQNAIDQSKISDACEISNSLLVQPAGLRFFRWTQSAWVEHFDFPNPGNTNPPFVVTTRDYTGDGLLDYLVGFQESAPYGGILSPTGTTCDWKWLTFTFPEGGNSTLVDNLSWSDETMVLSGLNKNGLNPTANLRFTFDNSNLELVGQDDPYNNPDMAWMGDACENEKRLLGQIFEASEISDGFFSNYGDNTYALQILKDWTGAMDDAIAAFQTVGPQTLNMTSKETFYLGELTVPSTRTRSYTGWYMALDLITNAHNQLASYCVMLPPRL